MEEKSGGKERFNISVLVVVFRLVLNEVLVTMTIAFKSFRKCLSWNHQYMTWFSDEEPIETICRLFSWPV